MKKILAVTLVTALMAGLTACASGKPQSQSPDTSTVQDGSAAQKKDAAQKGDDAQDVKELLVGRFSGGTADFQKRRIGEYTKAAVTIDDIDYSSMKEKLVLSFQSSKGTSGNYDVVAINGPWMTEFVEAGYLMPINDVAAACGIDLEIYDQNLLGNLNYDNQLYGLPFFLQCMVCAYDTAKFQELGLEVPQSYQELVETAAALKADGSGIALPAAQANGAYTVWSQLLYSAGGYPVADGSLAINSEECVNAAKRYQELVSYACEGSLGWGNEGVVAALQSGNASLGVMMSGNNGYLHDPSASAITETVSYFPFYGYENQASANQTYWVWAIPANCTDPQAAMEFISWACSQEMERQQTLETLAISGIPALAQDEDILKAVPFADIVMDEFKQGRRDPANANFDSLKSDMTVLLSELATGGDAKELLDELQAKHQGKDWS